MPNLPYVELHTASAFSFLEGASLPEDLVTRAAELGLPALALLDRNGVYGAPRLYKAAREAGLKALVGAEVVLDEPPEGKSQPRLSLLVRDQPGYKNLCKLLTAAAAGRPKGEARASWELVKTHSEGLHVLTGGEEGPVAKRLHAEGLDAARQTLERLSALFPGRLHVELQRHHLRDEEHRNQALLVLARRLGLPIVATNGVRYARREDKDLHDVLTCLHHKTRLDDAGRLLARQRERHLLGSSEMQRLFRDLPEAVAATSLLAEELTFTLKDLGYRFPDYPLPPGETPGSYLTRITWQGVTHRFGEEATPAFRAQIEKELRLIDRLELPGYFLIVWDVVQFCRREGILVQGRGSAANSAVCYALGITAIDPVKMDLLFERFLSAERGEWPDIDLDLPSGDDREKAIQYVYKTYGVHGAGMTANVITYRDRSAAREVAKVLGYPAALVDRLSKHLHAPHMGGYVERPADENAELKKMVAGAGLDPEDVRSRHFMRLFMRIQNLPRHLGQHSGGLVVAAGRLNEVVPLEPASMPGRVVVQWDKDDCADLGLIKIDLLGLGMLGAISEMLPMIERHEGVKVDLAHLPAGDPKVYAMLNAADTIGLFQVESRAQMASLPRHKPQCFYDIVVQVAIIRPGPIVGGMMKPFFERRKDPSKISYLDPSLEPLLKPILGRTLGVPIFQEQILKMAMVVAGFTGGEAEELRRAMGFKRSVERMHTIEARLRAGMTERGIGEAAQAQIVKSITSFALYGFPESHAASFALLAYASAYLKAHHPAAFFACLLNAWPCGFYHPATLVKDAQRHGTPVWPMDVTRSGWFCRWEERGVRLGLRFVKGLRAETGQRIELEASRRPFRDVNDLARRCELREDEMTRLAHAGALAGFGLTRREALWQAASAVRDDGPLFADSDRADNSPQTSPLAEMSPYEETLADYETAELTAGRHLMEHLRERLRAQGILSTSDLARCRDGQRVQAAGCVIVRQRPGTAKGFVFLTLEDEFGMVQAIVRPDLFREFRMVILSSPCLFVEGRLQKEDGAMSIRAERFERVPVSGEGLWSHDFH